jgi:hypothetical protein
MLRVADHDRLFKESLTTFFTEFLQFFFPQLAVYRDSDSVEFLDKELFTDVTQGERLEADMVVRTRFRGQGLCFLIHNSKSGRVSWKTSPSPHAVGRPIEIHALGDGVVDHVVEIPLAFFERHEIDAGHLLAERAHMQVVFNLANPRENFGVSQAGFVGVSFAMIRLPSSTWLAS